MRGLPCMAGEGRGHWTVGQRGRDENSWKCGVCITCAACHSYEKVGKWGGRTAGGDGARQAQMEVTVVSGGKSAKTWDGVGPRAGGGGGGGKGREQGRIDVSCMCRWLLGERHRAMARERGCERVTVSHLLRPASGSSSSESTLQVTNISTSCRSESRGPRKSPRVTGEIHDRPMDANL